MIDVYFTDWRVEGFATLITLLMGMAEEPTNVVAPVVRKLWNLGFVPKGMLATMAGALMAAAFGESPAAWRQSVGAFDPSRKTLEPLAWACTAWLLADLLDFANGRGTFAEFAEATFGSFTDAYPG